MREQKEVTVNGNDYILNQFGAIEGLKYQKALAQVILPALSEISKAGVEDESNAISIAMSKLAENIDKVDERMIEAMVSRGATKNSVAINFDNDFSGKYMELFQLLKEIVLFNFGSVFTMLGSEET
jgi:hypothetical protein